MRMLLRAPERRGETRAFIETKLKPGDADRQRGRPEEGIESIGRTHAARLTAALVAISVGMTLRSPERNHRECIMNETLDMSVRLQHGYRIWCLEMIRVSKGGYGHALIYDQNKMQHVAPHKRPSVLLT
jgi:hypothetical protein